LDKAIITSFLIIAGIICAVIIFNALYPAVVQGSAAMVTMQGRIDERLKSQIEIIHAVPDGVVTKRALVWVKNVGSTSLRPVERCDVFFGPEGSFVLIPYNTGTAPQWTYTVENDDAWKPTATLRIAIDVSDDLVDGTRYYVKIVLPNGVSDDYYFTK